MNIKIGQVWEVIDDHIKLCYGYDILADTRFIIWDTYIPIRSPLFKIRIDSMLMWVHYQFLQEHCRLIG